MNGFIAAEKGSEVVLTLLTQVLANIHARTSNNVWAVTGPGVLNAYVNEHESGISGMIEIGFEDFRKHIKIENELSYKARHWSKLQQHESIYKE